MDDLLTKLESRIKQLICDHKGLQVSNEQLNQGKFNVVREKTKLLKKQQGAIKQIETLISRLKSIEQSS